MTINSSWGLAILLATGAIVGCGQSRTQIRGQSPTTTTVTTETMVEADGPIIGSAPGYAEQTKRPLGKHSHKDFKVYEGFRDNNFGYEGGYYAGPEGYYTDHDRTYTVGGHGSHGGCPACEYGKSCPNGSCEHCGCKGHCGPGGFPKHYQTYRFDWPQNQVYPPPVMPAGMVQYPYYTLRGPTDFFMK